MKIKLVHWPINNIGGILTWIREVKWGFQQFGHEVEVVCPADYHPRPETMAKDSYDKGVPACNVWPIVSDTELNKTMAMLNSADFVLFCHPSPHPTKDQRRKVADGLRWKQVYERLTVPRLVVFHDNNWQKTNAWFADVSEHVPAIMAAQHIFMESVEKYPTTTRFWSYFPIRVPEGPINQVRAGGLMATQWLRWKRHREFMEKLAELQAVTTFDFYNGGIEYWYLRKEEPFQKYVGDIGDPEEQIIQYRGPVPHEEIVTAMQRALFCVDYSKRGYTNYTHWEPLLFGAYSFTHEDVIANPYCELPDMSPMVVPFNDDNIVEMITHVQRTNPTQERLDVREWCRARMDPRHICRRLLGERDAGVYDPR